MSVVRWPALVLFLVVMAAFFQDYRSWELLAAAVALALVLFWSCGAFTREAWFGSVEQDAECARVDAELDAIDRSYP